jgi:hypothetical protein
LLRLLTAGYGTERYSLRRTDFRSLSEALRTCGEPVATLGLALMTHLRHGRTEIPQRSDLLPDRASLEFRTIQACPRDRLLGRW